MTRIDPWRTPRKPDWRVKARARERAEREAMELTAKRQARLEAKAKWPKRKRVPKPRPPKVEKPRWFSGWPVAKWGDAIVLMILVQHEQMRAREISAMLGDDPTSITNRMVRLLAIGAVVKVARMARSGSRIGGEAFAWRANHRTLGGDVQATPQAPAQAPAKPPRR